MAQQKVVAKLQEVCNSISEMSNRRPRLIHRPEWGEIDFEGGSQDIEMMFWLVDETSRLPVEILPDYVIEHTTTQFQQITERINDIEEFSVRSGDPASLRDEIINQLQSDTQNALNAIGQWLPLLALRAGEIENWTAKMKETSADMTRMLQDAEQSADTGKKNIDAAVEAARAAAGEAGAAEFTHEFRNEAGAMEERGKRWLWPTSIFAGLALCLSLWFVIESALFPQFPGTFAETIYRLGGRLIAISVLFYAAVWSGRVALANMHLASINKHRAVSIQTLRAFHQAADDPAAKDAVVLEAARAVYENVPTGYVLRQSAEPVGIARTVELIKGVGRSSRSMDN